MIVKKVELKQKWESEPAICACIGYFDGLHIGHRALIDKTLEKAKEKKCSSALITFDPDPWVVLKGEENIPHLTSMEERIEIGESLGIDYWIILSFSKVMAGLPPQQFIDEILVPLNIQTLVCGFDFSFGAFGKGNFEYLKEHAPFETCKIDKVLFQDEKISSTRIEEAIRNGNVDLANKMLGRSYRLTGKVIHGNHLGHDIGFPTANLDLIHEYVLPQRGVYAGWCTVDGFDYPAIINLGHNPTFNMRKHLSIEVHLLNFDQDIYGEMVSLEFAAHLRDEICFQSKEELICQLNKDKETAFILLGGSS